MQRSPDIIVTPAALTRAAGAAAVAAGAIFNGVQVGHPPLNATSITTTSVEVRDYLKVQIAKLNPGYVNDVIAVDTARGTVHGDIGALKTAIQVQGFAYLAGGLIFGIALYRANGVAMIGLGYSLWQTTPTRSTT